MTTAKKTKRPANRPESKACGTNGHEFVRVEVAKISMLTQELQALRDALQDVLVIWDLRGGWPGQASQDVKRLAEIRELAK